MRHVNVESSTDGQAVAVRLVCSGCGCPGPEAATLERARAMALSDGWVLIPRILCPICQPNPRALRILRHDGRDWE
jgi:hypothetical protein